MKLDFGITNPAGLAHMQEHVLGVFWYNPVSGQMDMSTDKSITHWDQSFIPIKGGSDKGWVRGRVFSYEGKNYILLMADKETTAMAESIKSAVERTLNIVVNHMVDPNKNEIITERMIKQTEDLAKSLR